MVGGDTGSAGSLVARILAGSWRSQPPPVDFSAYELESVEDRLMASGSAGLTWNRIKYDPRIAGSDVGSRFADAHRMHILHAGLHDQHLSQVLTALGDAGVRPIVFKGWDSSRLYPDRGMRPFGDIDLLIPPSQLEFARETLRDHGGLTDVDLEHPVEMGGSSLNELFERAVPTEHGGVEVLTLSDEDRLRVLCIHFLKSGGWRPLNLCDIAAVLEGGGVSDASTCLTTSRAVVSWVGSTIACARDLLGADLGASPWAGGLPPAPRWLTKAIIEAWGHPFPAEWGPAPPLLPPLSDPVGVARNLPQRWPSPVVSTIMTGSPVNRLPRPPFQLAYLARRAARYLATQKER